MAPVDVNLQYDFDYQQFTYLPNEVTVLPVSNHIPVTVANSRPLRITICRGCLMKKHTHCVDDLKDQLQC